MTTIMVELGVAMTVGNGDSGTWTTDYVEIPGDTPEDDIEQVARDAYQAQLAGAPVEVAHTWLYHWEYLAEEGKI